MKNTFEKRNREGVDTETIKKLLLQAEEGQYAADTANTLIANKEGSVVAKSIDKFNEIAQEAIARKLLETGQGMCVTRNIDKFKDSNHQRIAQNLIEGGLAQSVANNLQGFEKINYQFLADKLLETEEIECLKINLGKFKELNHKIAEQLIEQKNSKEVINNLTSFKESEHQNIIEALILSGEGVRVLDGLGRFKITDYRAVLHALIGNVNTYNILQKKEMFKNIDENHFIDYLIAKGEGAVIANCINSFERVKYKEIAYKLIEAGDNEEVAANIKKFKGVNNEELAYAMIESYSGGNAVGFYLKDFIGIDHKKLVSKLIAEGQVNVLIIHLKNFKELNCSTLELLIREGITTMEEKIPLTSFINLDAKMANLLVNLGRSEEVADNLERFNGINYADLAERIINEGKGSYVADNLEKFKGIDHSDVARELLARANGGSIISNIEKFNDINHDELVIELIKIGFGSRIPEILNKLEGVSQQKIVNELLKQSEGKVVASHVHLFTKLNHDHVANQLIDSNFGHDLRDFLEYFHELGYSTAKKLITDFSGGADVIENFASFTFSLREEAIDIFNSTRDYFENIHFPRLIKIERDASEKYGGVFNKNIRKTEKAFGTLASYDLFKYLELSDDPEAIQKIQKKIIKLKHDVLGDEEIIKSFPKDPLITSIYRNYIRFDDAMWRLLHNDIFSKIIKVYEQKKSEPMKEYFTPSDSIEIAKSKEKKIAYTEDFVTRFNILRTSVKEAKDIFESNNKPFTYIAKTIQKKIEEIKNKNNIKLKKAHEEVREGLNKKSTHFKIKNLTEKNAQLEAINTRSMKDFQENIVVLAQYEELRHTLRTALFLFSFSENKAQLDNNWDNIYTWDEVKESQKTEKITITQEDIVASLNFISHITTQETLGRRFKDREIRSVINKLMSTRSFEEQMYRITNEEERGEGSIKLKFIPTRNLLTEFSGHIGDTCWVGRYYSILEKYPNVTSLTMVQNQGTPHERLAGSCLLFETETELGERLLIIRGLNPRENTINQLNTDDFYVKLTNYLQDIAKKDKRTLAVAIDDHVAGFGTNRPKLQEYMSKEKARAKHYIKLGVSADEDTNFNGYSIEGGVYRVE